MTLTPPSAPLSRRPVARRLWAAGRAGEGKGEREDALTHGLTPWAKLCRSSGAELCCELRLQHTGVARAGAAWNCRQKNVRPNVENIAFCEGRENISAHRLGERPSRQFSFSA
jgi:hypothetical protein